MKKLILLFLSVAAAQLLSAQISVGLSVGNNFSTINRTGDYSNLPSFFEIVSEENSVTNGLTFGIPVEVGFSNRFSLFSGLSYLQKGTKQKSVINYTTLNETEEGNGNTKFNYLEIPILAKLYFVKRKVNVYFMAGPDFGYLLSSRTKADIKNYNTETGTEETSKVDIKYGPDEMKELDINRLDVSLNGGMGCETSLWIGKLYFNINYVLGLTEMRKDNSDINKGITEYNRGLTTTLGFLIPLKK